MQSLWDHEVVCFKADCGTFHSVTCQCAVRNYLARVTTVLVCRWEHCQPSQLLLRDSVSFAVLPLLAVQQGKRYSPHIRLRIIYSALCKAVFNRSHTTQHFLLQGAAWPFAFKLATLLFESGSYVLHLAGSLSTIFKCIPVAGSHSCTAFCTLKLRTRDTLSCAPCSLPLPFKIPSFLLFIYLFGRSTQAPRRFLCETTDDG